MIRLDPRDIPDSEREPLIEEARQTFGDAAAEQLRERFLLETPQTS